MRLTERQVELLTDLATKREMYIAYGSTWDRTATSMVRKGLASNHFCGGHQYEVRITQPGRAEAIRRRIIAADTTGEETDHG